jgi:ribosome-binding protein aMBF1 (putative translation factor)
MKRKGLRTFKGRLRKELKAPEFKRQYEGERQAFQLAIKLAALREQKGLSQRDLAKRMVTSHHRTTGKCPHPDRGGSPAIIGV